MVKDERGQIMISEEADEQLTVAKYDVLADCDKCADRCNGWVKPSMERIDRNNGMVVREILSQIPNAKSVFETSRVADVYKAVGDVALQKMSDGTYSATLRNADGTIKKQVKLQKATPTLASAASVGYSALNAVVGQANMMSIAESLRRIEEGIEEIKERSYSDARAKVEAACCGLREHLRYVPEDQQKLASHLLMNDLREGIFKLKAYIGQEIDNMPDLTSIGFANNWGLKRSTKPERAKRHFMYIVKALDPLCRGLIQYAVAEAFLCGTKEASAIEMLEEVHGIIGELNKSGKVKLVPMLAVSKNDEAIDPVKKMNALSDAIRESIHALGRGRKQAENDKILIPIRAEYLKEVDDGKM